MTRDRLEVPSPVVLDSGMRRYAEEVLVKRAASLWLIPFAALAVLSASLMVQPSPAGAADSQDARVVVVLAPYLRWEDISSSDAPFLLSLAEDGAVGNVNVRSPLAGSLAGSPDLGALMLSAGSWASFDPAAPGPYGLSEFYEGGASGEAFERMTGVSAEGYEVVYLGMPRTRRSNEAVSTIDARVGLLGQSVTDAGGQTAVVGNADSGYEVRGIWRSRPGALVAMDAEGRVCYGEIGTDLLRNEPAAPFGYETDPGRFESALDRVSRALAEEPGPDLIVLDPGDLQRAHEFEPDVAPHVFVDHHRRAVRSLDGIVRMATSRTGEDGLLLVVTPITRGGTAGTGSLAPMIVSGAGWEGYLTSRSTQREGLVTNADVTATVLDALGIGMPTSVLGTPMDHQVGPQAAEDRIERLIGVNAHAVAIDTARSGVRNGFIVLAVCAFLLAALVLLRAKRWDRRMARLGTSVVRGALLFTLCVPVASFLMLVPASKPTDPVGAVLVLLALSTLLWALALLLQRSLPPRVPVIVLALLMSLVLIVDQFLGAPLSFSSFLSYSPLAGFRYYGLGNEGAALLVGSALVGLAFLIDEYAGSTRAHAARRWLFPMVGLVVIVVSAAPFMGANVAVAIWGVVGFMVAWALLNRVRLSWRMIALALLVMVLFIGLFSAVDLAGDAGGGTHLARAWSSAASGGAGELWLIVARKAETNVRVLTATSWSYLLLAVLALLGFMRWRPYGEFAKALADNPGFSAATAAGLAAGVAASVTEDSGIVIPALILLYVGAGILCLMLTDPGAQASSREEAESAGGGGEAS